VIDKVAGAVARCSHDEGATGRWLELRRQLPVKRLEYLRPSQMLLLAIGAQPHCLIAERHIMRQPWQLVQCVDQFCISMCLVRQFLILAHARWLEQHRHNALDQSVVQHFRRYVM
jgi:hypothetical protein